MTEWNFQLRLNRVPTDDEVDALYDAGLSDAGVTIEADSAYLDVTREASAIVRAITSAIDEVANVSGLAVVGVEFPDEVTLEEAEQRLRAPDLTDLLAHEAAQANPPADLPSPLYESGEHAFYSFQAIREYAASRERHLLEGQLRRQIHSVEELLRLQVELARRKQREQRATAREAWRDWLMRAMQARRIDRKELCRITGLEPQTISRWLNAKATPSEIASIQVAQALHVDPRESLRAGGHVALASFLTERERPASPSNPSPEFVRIAIREAEVPEETRRDVESEFSAALAELEKATLERLARYERAFLGDDPAGLQRGGHREQQSA